MRKLTKLILVIFLLWTMVCGLWTISFAAVPHLINYQGRLTDSSGQPLNGSYNLTFRIYDAETVGNLLWQETHSAVLIQKGIFSILLGSVTNLDLAFDKPYHLEIKVGEEVMSPRQRMTSVGYAIRAEDADKVDGKHASDLVQVGAAAGGSLTGSYPNPTIADGAVSQVKLKTATGEVSADISLGTGGQFGVVGDYNSTTTTYVTELELIGRDGGWGIKIILPGGEYGFFPQFKRSGATGYWKQRYVTASGQDWWLFLLADKQTKNIISAYSTPDHPAYGNGGDFDKVPHPFLNYDPNKQEIVLVDKETVTKLKQESKATEKSLLTLINEKYRINMAKEEPYIPLHTGKFLTEDGKQVMQMVKALPQYIKVRKLIKKDQQTF